MGIIATLTGTVATLAGIIPRHKGGVPTLIGIFLTLIEIISTLKGITPIYIGVNPLFKGMTRMHLSEVRRVAVVRFIYLTVIHDLSSWSGWLMRKSKRRKGLAALKAKSCKE